MKKRLLSILLMCCMVLTLLPVTALAEDSAYTVGEDTSVSARALDGTAGTKLKADNIDAYVASGLGSGVYTLAEDDHLRHAAGHGRGHGRFERPHPAV